MASHDLTTVSLPRPLFEKIKQVIEGTGFHTVSSYVVYVLRQILSEEKLQGEKKEPFSREEEERVKTRLKSLGYLK